MPTKLSKEQQHEAFEAYKAGASLHSLAQRFQCADATVRECLVRQGATINPKGNRSRTFTEEELTTMQRMWGDGCSQQAIAQVLGCSQTVVSGQLASMGVSSAERHNRGAHHANYKGGRITLNGYDMVLLQPDHPFRSMAHRAGYVMEHRLVMAEHLGRPLDPSETVHHCNGNRKDNRIENLQLRQGKHGRGVTMVCRACGSHNVSPVTLT